MGTLMLPVNVRNDHIVCPSHKLAIYLIKNVYCILSDYSDLPDMTCDTCHNYLDILDNNIDYNITCPISHTQFRTAQVISQ